MNNLEIAENPYYTKLVSIKESTDEFGLYFYTITIIAEMEGHEFKFEQQLDFFEGEAKVSHKKIEKYFNEELLNEDIDLTDMNCWSNNTTPALKEQMKYAYVFPDC